MEHWINDIEKVTSTVQQKLGNLSEDELNWKPNPKSWSVAQVLDHVMLINESYFEVMTKLRSGTLNLPFFYRFEIFPGLFGAFLKKAVDPETSTKLKTLKIWIPEESVHSPEIVEQFIKHQEKLKLYIHKLEDHVAKGAVAHSPINRNLVLKIDAMIDILISHEKRHLKQMKEVLGLMQSSN